MESELDFCTTILVGKNATYDGSTMMARTEDAPSGHFFEKKHIVVKPENQPRHYKAVSSKFEIDLPDNPLQYTSMPMVKKSIGVYGEAGINVKNVAVSETETITSNALVLGADPLVDNGLGEEDILTIVLPYISSAREGVKRLGDNSGSDIGDKGDSKRNEVRKEFSLDFEKKIAKFIPPKKKFIGDISKKSLVTMRDYTKDFGEDVFIGHLTLFNRFILLTVSSNLHFYNKIFNLIFSHKFVDGKKEEILSLNPYNDETLVIGATDIVRIVNFYEKKKNEITFEVIQEFNESEFYGLNEKLFNGYLLVCGFDRKYCFYEPEKEEEKLSKENLFKLVNKVELVHNVYDDDCPGIVDLNNGRIFSWLNDDKNIKVLDYTPQQRIIYSKNGYGLHNAGLVSDKYLLLMGLIYPKYYTWIMDTESLEIVYKWQTPQNDSFMTALSENKFLYGSESRLACDEFSVENNQFKRKIIYEDYYCKDKKESWEDSFGVKDFLNERTFITINVRGKMMVYYCKEK